MVRRRKRIPVVIDTNVLIASFLSSTENSPNSKVIKLWRDRKLQLIVSQEIKQEYFEIFERLNIPQKLIHRFTEKIDNQETVTHVKLGKRFTESKDPKDNIFLSTARGGKAQFLISNDSDLLDIPIEIRKKFRFQVLNPNQFIGLMTEKGLV